MKLFNFFKPKIKKMKMYVIVRMDLSETYRMVQGAHALAQYALDYPNQFEKWGNQTIIFLKVRNFIEMKNLKNELELSKKSFSIFFEQDLDYHATAIACYDDGYFFKNMKTV